MPTRRIYKRWSDRLGAYRKGLLYAFLGLWLVGMVWARLGARHQPEGGVFVHGFLILFVVGVWAFYAYSVAEISHRDKKPTTFFGRLFYRSPGQKIAQANFTLFLALIASFVAGNIFFAISS